MYNFDVSDIEDVKLKNYVNLLNDYKQKTNKIYESVESSLTYLQTLQENYSQVSEKTNSLHNACEQILSDQVMCKFNDFFLITFSEFYLSKFVIQDQACKHIGLDQ